jgi:homoserine kinase
MPGTVSVSVPASSANLGPGFDCLAVALPLRLHVTVERRDGPLEIRCAGRGAASLPRDASNLVVRSFARLWDGDLDGLAFSLDNEIPLAAGAGSSSAAILAGLAAATALAGRPLAQERLLAEAAAIEGHADNVAAGLRGGVTLAVDDPPLVRRLPPPAGLAFVLAVSQDALATHESRRALRPTLPRADAVHSLQRAALLVDVLRTGPLSLLPRALSDRLHEPDRRPLTPLLATLDGPAQDLGAFGVTLSGAGPSVLVWTPHERLERIRAGVAAIVPEAEVLALAPEPRGLELREAAPQPPGRGTT